MSIVQIKMEETGTAQGPTRTSFTDHIRSASPDEYFKANPTGKLLSSGQLQIILNVYTWLRKTTPPMMPTDAVLRTAEMCGVGIRTVVKARKTIRDGKKLASPKRTRTFREKKIPANTILDDYTKSSVRRKVHEAFFIKENVTLEGLKRKIDSDLSFPIKMSMSTIHRCLKMVGFRYEKRGQNKVMVEREDIIFWRRNYIRQIRQHRQQCRPIVYLDETWLKSVSTTPKTARQAFVEGLLSGPNIADGNGGNCIIMHDGKKDACVGSIQVAFLAKRDTGDNADMNEERFQKWFEEKLLPNIPERSVIVVDNAQDSPLPDRSAKKCVIQEWLTKRKIPWTSNMSKGDLHATLVANAQQTKHYMIDHLVQDKGYDILRLPPYHFELNPIEMAWGKVKQEAAITTATFKMKDMREKLDSAVAAVTLKDWENYVDHVMKIEENFWLVDCLQGEHEGLGIGLNDMDCEEDMDEDVDDHEWT